MSTTVNYKGNTIATLDNETKTLTTAGTWLEDNIEIVDVSSGGSQSLIVDTPDVNGGTIREITTDTVVMLEGAKTVTPSSTQQIITPSQGYNGFSSVMVEAGIPTLNTMSFTDVRGVKIDIDSDWLNSYDYILLVPDITLSSSDWVYRSADSMTNDTTNINYTNGSISTMDERWVTIITKSPLNTQQYGGVTNGWHPNGVSFTIESYLYFYTYSSNKTMSGTFNIYGVTV